MAFNWLKAVWNKGLCISIIEIPSCQQKKKFEQRNNVFYSALRNLANIWHWSIYIYLYYIVYIIFIQIVFRVINIWDTVQYLQVVSPYPEFCPISHTIATHTSPDVSVHARAALKYVNLLRWFAFRTSKFCHLMTLSIAEIKQLQWQRNANCRALWKCNSRENTEVPVEEHLQCCFVWHKSLCLNKPQKTLFLCLLHFTLDCTPQGNTFVEDLSLSLLQGG